MFRTFLKRSIGPVTLIVAGTTAGQVFIALALIGGIWESIVFAKLIDGDFSRKARARLKLPRL